MITKPGFLIAAAAFAVIGASQPAEASLFGCGKKCQARKAAEQQELQRRLDSQAQWEAQQRAAAQQQAANQQAQWDAQQRALADQRAREQAQWDAQQRAAQQQAAREQAQWEAQQRAEERRANQQFQPQQPLPTDVSTQAGFSVEVDKNGVPLYGPDGKPLSDKDKALWPFRHQEVPNMPVIVTERAWTDYHEQKFSEFVARFGAGVKAKPMRRLNFYMHDAGTNMYADSEIPTVYYYTDCADLPVFLRAYFAYKNGLPMSVATDPVMNMQPYASAPSDGYTTWSQNNPTRTEVSPYGNSLSRRAASNVPTQPNGEKNFIKWWSALMDATSTRTFMVSPFTPNYNLSDVYPVKMDRDGIRPGTVVHSDGHVLMVTSVFPNGDVELMDAHPDNSLQFKTLDPSKLMRERPDRAYGFFRFRPMQAVGGQAYVAQDGRQGIYGAKIVTASDSELFQQGKWSVEQWMGPGSNIGPGQQVNPTQWKSAYANIGFFELLRANLSTRTETADGASNDLLVSLCNDLKQRVADIEAAGSLPTQPRPATLPQNIYNAEPTWEQFATPSRDGRTRQAILNLPGLIAKNFKNGVRNQYKISYAGSATQYQQAILQAWSNQDASCKVTYKNSAGQPVTIGFSELVKRAPRMSFDYADCPEKRWGASDQEIAATCRDSDPSGRWYRAEQSMRNGGGKTNDNGTIVVRSDRPITIDMLESGRFVDQGDSAAINLGFSKSKQMDVKAYFASPQFVQDLSR